MGLETEASASAHNFHRNLLLGTLDLDDPAAPMGMERSRGMENRRPDERDRQLAPNYKGKTREARLWNCPMEEHLREHGERWQATAANGEVWKRRTDAEWVSKEYENRRVWRRATG